MKLEVVAIVSALLIPHSGFSQNAANLGSVKRLFVDSFGEKPGASNLRDNVAALLARSHSVTVERSQKKPTRSSREPARYG
jgi:hypothetical protein